MHALLPNKGIVRRAAEDEAGSQGLLAGHNHLRKALSMSSDGSRHTKEKIREAVRDGYGKIAKSGSGCGCSSKSCCGSGTAEQVARGVGYSEAELAVLPEGANMGLSCGNPTALASLRPGEVVLDLGSGGGFDVFIAGPKVGPTGRVIGVDMTPDMVSKARRGIATYNKRTSLDNVEFRLGEIEYLPVADASVDVVISNCVINLSPDKAQVWREIARVLKPGGRVAVSDLALLRALPEALRDSVTALIGCVAGAVLVDETKAMVQAAGLTDAVFETKSQYVDSMASWSDPLYRDAADQLPPGTKPSDYVTSLSITAAKPTPTLTVHTKELIAVGASVTAHCQPCLTYHVGKAREMGIAEQDIREAVAVGHQVEKGSMAAMTVFAKGVLDSSTQNNSACCTGQTSPDGKSCCS
jgi:arsenite methyltransferase